MPRTVRNEAAALDLLVALLTAVCLHLDLRDLVCITEACKTFFPPRQRLAGDFDCEKLPTKSPVATAPLAFPGGELIPSTRLLGCSDSWIVYLARFVRQRS
jgi:hypothetical protein